MDDVLVVGAGPAGSVAATVLARVGARVHLVDRAMFPRDKVCGDTLNPGTLALLRRLQLEPGVEERALRLDGMLVTGEGGVAVEGRYPAGLHGLALRRRDLDWMLLQQAVAAGAAFDSGPVVRGALVGERRGRPVVEGVCVGSNGLERIVGAPAGARGHCRRWPAVDAGLRAGPVAPSGAPEALGRRSVF